MTANLIQSRNRFRDGLALLRMALRALRRDWQSGELRVLAAALLIAIASVAAVGFFNDRIQQVMERKASELLGADLVVTAPTPVQPALVEEARRLGLETGLRRHNVTHLRWEQVDLERRLVWIPGEKTKNGKPLGMPLSATATQVLMQQKGNHREYVFIYQDGPVYQTSTRAFKAAAKRAGLPADFRWHDLRHQDFRQAP